MIIGKRITRKLRKPRRCGFCPGMVTVDAIRLFGAATRFDPKHNIYFHKHCYRLHQGGYRADELEQDNPYNGGSNEG